MATIVDARGLSCPQPVILTLDEIKKGKDMVLGFLKKTKIDPREKKRNISIDRGILVFENTSEVIQAENILKKNRLVRAGHGASSGNSARMRPGY